MRYHLVMQKFIARLLILLVLLFGIYGVGRLYYILTDGFTVGNMTAEFPYHPEWETLPLNAGEASLLDSALSQPYSYLGKGCQAYVFESEDGHYVAKFFKYQRFRLKPWEAYLPSFPFVDEYRNKKIQKKQRKLEGFLFSWVVAFNHLKNETGLIYVHLNKTNNLKKVLPIRDKLGFEHKINLDDYQFCIQRKAELLSTALLKLRKNDDRASAIRLVNQVLALLLSDYSKGFIDNDPALMQNTGVVEGIPIHIDIGQLVQDQRMESPYFFLPDFMMKRQELNDWLKIHYPEILDIGL